MTISQDDTGLWILLIHCYQVEIFFRWVNGCSCSLLTLGMTLSLQRGTMRRFIPVYRKKKWNSSIHVAATLTHRRRVWMPSVSADAMDFISLWCWHRDSDVISEGALELIPKKVTGKSSAHKSQSTLSPDDANLLFFPFGFVCNNIRRTEIMIWAFSCLQRIQKDLLAKSEGEAC